MSEIGGKKTATIFRQLSAEKMRPIPIPQSTRALELLYYDYCHRYHRYIYRYMARYMDIIVIYLLQRNKY